MRNLKRAAFHADTDACEGGGSLASVLNDASVDQMLAINTGLRIIAWNRACEEIHGISREEAMCRSFIDVHPRAAEFPAIMEGIVNGLKGRKSFVPWEKGAYTEHYLEHHFIPLRGADQQVTGVLVVIHDVAHRIKAEKKLEALNEALQQKAKLLQQKTDELREFNRITSHDLKEPLRKIYTFIELVATNEGQKISDAARSNLRRAQSAVQRMGLLTDDMVTFSEVASPDDTPGTVDLEQLLAQTLARQQALVRERDATIDRDELPVITAYPRLLQLLMQHMLNNALKFHGEGKKPVVAVRYSRLKGTETGVEAADPEASYHRLSFTDNGIGIAPEYHEKIFGMFQRLHQPGVYKGTGMGLPICCKITDAHRGFITVESAEDAGSTFHCYLRDLDE